MGSAMRPGKSKSSMLLSEGTNAPAIRPSNRGRSRPVVSGRCDGPTPCWLDIATRGSSSRDSVTHDDAASVEAARAFYATFDARVEDEVRRLGPVRPALIVGDIPPLAFGTAARLGIPSLAIANFTWGRRIYAVMPGFERDAPGVLATIRGAYAQATRALALPFTGGFEVFPTSAPLPLVARHATLIARGDSARVSARSECRPKGRSRCSRSWRLRSLAVARGDARHGLPGPHGPSSPPTGRALVRARRGSSRCRKRSSARATSATRTSWPRPMSS